MTPLRDPLRSLLDDPIEHEALERVRRRVHASRQMNERPELVASSPWRWAPAAAAILVAAIGAGVWWTYPVDDARPAIGPITIGGASLGALREGRHALDDGSTLELGAGAHVEPIENGAHRVIFAQGDGRVTYDVRPHGPRRWTIDAGALSIDVVGTRFTIEREGPAARVEVERGRVRVRGASVEGGIRELGAGEWIAVPAPVAPEGNEEVAAAPPPAEAPAPSAHPLWRTLADRGAYDDAFDAIGAEGLARQSRRSGSVEELFALADTARLSGHADLAVDPLRRIADEHGAEPRAGLAALTLGRLELDALDDPSAAAVALDRALALGVPSHLEEIAHARAIEAHQRAGHAERAAELARAYLERFPDGRNVERARAVLP